MAKAKRRDPSTYKVNQPKPDVAVEPGVAALVAVHKIRGVLATPVPPGAFFAPRSAAERQGFLDSGAAREPDETEQAVAAAVAPAAPAPPAPVVEETDEVEETDDADPAPDADPLG